ncbi:Serine/threonine-protein kinase pknK [Serratia rubidaea]|uniref:Serine/threonine-protein kinase pknK n=1 Tax=Serratia rubidaea TaxID=61652 RepID=A0A4U9H854_SERRU|nr:LuxR C-terminal-related transcriptional regulator [Serratia rubidaea]QPR65065.1 winged helix-turn-helix transcriptional regulator [Serratia rubidaea]CAI0982642.1 Serine/threonine-protein kinase pknK [Serratia rubidaea]CAI1790010.1 Serine/threonine-protein kinase pknK [Serratia rubidaea]VTP59675.1 Serine/threonine-protein kinase pknK [Serratia rubidaea]HAY0637853.1 winged helix-turn-helix transcriptional regulator [Serratia rubidaea]
MKQSDVTGSQSTSLVSGPLRLTRGLPLILTKFVPPRSSAQLLPRPRLLECLDQVRLRRLAIVCAGAGFGKTTLLAQWHRQLVDQGEHIAWLSLDEDDDDVWQFIPYLLHALRPLYAGWDADFWQNIKDHAPSSSQQLLAGLINQLHACPHDLYLIIDDFHMINNAGVHEALSYLLRHAPAALHLIVGSRFHPSLSLRRLQAQEQLVEIHDRDLQFTLDETRSYFSQTVAVPLSNQDALRLVSATEGWIAGMKIASLSPELREDPGQLIHTLRGGTRSIARYLQEVVLDPLPAEVLDFLLQTAFLNRLNAELCNAVTGRDDSEAMLEWIERHNLFLSALDEQGYWFRYHPLLQETLSAALRHRADINLKQLHERASHWFVERLLWAEAVRHALAAGKPVHNPGQDGASAQSLAEEGDIDTLVSWMRHLPASVDPSRIDLQTNLAWALAHHFRFDESRQLLDSLDQMVASHRDGMARSARIKLRVVRAICEAFAENIPESLAIVEPLLAEVPCGDTWVDGLICNILSYCHVIDQRYTEALAVQRHMPSPDTPLDNLFVSVYRAFIIAQCHLHQGDLENAERYAGNALRQAERYTGPHSTSGATLAPLLAEIAYERRSLESLDRLLADRLELIDRFSPPDALSRCYTYLARQAMHGGMPHEAERLLEHAQQLAVSRGWQRLHVLLLAEQVRVRLQHAGRPGAEALQRQLEQLARHTAIDAEHPCQRAIAQHAALSRSRLLLAAGQTSQACKLLAELVSAQEKRRDWLTAARLRALWAVALWKSGKNAAACTTLQPVMQLAEHPHLMHSFLEVGDSLQPLLSHLQADPADNPQGAQLSPVNQATQSGEPRQQHNHDVSSGLSERELQILRLIAEGQTNKDIARSLAISAQTVKWHLKNAYAKLNVNSRTQAMSRALEMNLLD